MRTPGQWKTYRIPQQPWRIICDVNQQEICTVYNNPDNQEQRDDNAAFIVTSCNAHDTLVAENERLREALRDIMRGDGAYSPNPLEHAANCIDNMKEIARTALGEE